MFSKSAALYDAIYTRMKNCEDEAAQVRAWIEKFHPAAKTMLDVACGTGEHAQYSKQYFQIDGLDLSPDLDERAIASGRSGAGGFRPANGYSPVAYGSLRAAICHPSPESRGRGSRVR